MRVMVILSLTFLATTAWADSTTDLFRQFDLLGEWAVQCGAAASPDNPHVSTTLVGPDVVVETHNLGTEYAVNTYSILSAKRLDDHRLEVEVIFQPGKNGEARQQLVFQVRGDTRRTIYNKPDEAKKPLVNNGVVLANGIKMPLLKKCQ